MVLFLAFGLNVAERSQSVDAVLLYNVEWLSWNKLGNDIFGEAELDSFGKSVALSSDGSIGKNHWSYSQLRILVMDKRNSGHVRLMNQWNGTTHLGISSVKVTFDGGQQMVIDLALQSLLAQMVR